MRSILSVLLIILLFLGSLGYVSNRLQNPEFLVEQTREVNLYGRLSGQLDKVLPDDFISSYPLTPDEVTEVITSSITADEFYEFLNAYSGTYLNYWGSRTDTLVFNYDLTNTKDRAKVSLSNKLLSNYSKLPICSTEQAKNWDISKEFPECQLKEGVITDSSLEQQLKSQVGEALESIPSSIVVDGANQQQETFRENFTRANNIVKIVWIAILVLAILSIVVFRQRAFIPLSISLLFVGIIQIGFSMVAWDWIARNVSDYFAQYEASELTPLAVDIAGAVLEVLKSALGNITIIILGAGVTLLVLGIASAVMRGRKAIKT